MLLVLPIVTVDTPAYGIRIRKIGKVCLLGTRVTTDATDTSDGIRAGTKRGGLRPQPA